MSETIKYSFELEINKSMWIFTYSGISSFAFTKHGQGFFLVSSSEYVRVTLSARYNTEPDFSIELKDGMRIIAPEPEAIPQVTVTEPTETETAEEEETV